MKRGQGPGQWTKVLRRGAALFLATVTVWVLSLTADMGAAAETFRTLAESPAFVAAALQAELGHVETGTDTLDALESWQRLVLDQSPTLMAGRAQVSRYLSDATAQGDADPEPPQPSAVQEPDDPEDPHQLPASTTAPDDIVGRTLAPVSGDGYASAGGVYIENRPGLPLDVAALASAALTLELPAEETEETLPESISLGQIDLGDVLGNTSYSIPIQFPSGVTPWGSASHYATVTLSFDGLATRQLEVTNIVLKNVPQGYDANLVSQKLYVWVRGNPTLVERIDPSQLQVEVDLSGLSRGDELQRVAAQVTLKEEVEGVGVMGNHYSVALHLEKQ